MSLSGGDFYSNYLLSSEAFKSLFESFSIGNDRGGKTVAELRNGYEVKKVDLQGY